MSTYKKKILKISGKLIIIFVLCLYATGCSPNVEQVNKDSHKHPTKQYTSIELAKEVGIGEKVIIHPLHITQEVWRINDSQPEWEGEDFYRMIAYDQESDVVHVEVLVSNVEGEVLHPSDFIRVEGEWLEPEGKNAPILWGHDVEVIDDIEGWDARPGDM